MTDIARRIVAVLIALRALTNLGKPFAAGSGFVMLGRLLHGAASTVVAPQFAPWMYVVFAVPGIVVPWLGVWLLGRK